MTRLQVGNSEVIRTIKKGQNNRRSFDSAAQGSE